MGIIQANEAIHGWRCYKQRYLLKAVQCIGCKKCYYPKHFVCVCGSMVFNEYYLAGRGVLESFTQVIQPTAEFSEMTPYCIGMIMLEEGVRVLGQIADVALEELKIGMPVEAVLRKFYTQGSEGIIHYGIKFAPVT